MHLTLCLSLLKCIAHAMMTLPLTEKCLWMLLRIPEDNICYIYNTNLVKSVRQSQREHLIKINTARGSDGERKFLFLCFLILVMIIISATFTCTVHTPIHLTSVKSELIQVRPNEEQQITNVSLDVLHQEINDLSGTLNISIEQIQVR